MQTLKIIALSLLLLIFPYCARSGVALSKYFSTAEMNAANTAGKTSFMTAEEKEVLRIINLARMYPSKFLKLYLDYAGVSATRNSFYTSLTADLQRAKAVSALLPDKEMQETAKCWAQEAGTKGLTGHERKGCRGGYSAECCYYGGADPLGIVLCLLIDEGVPSLGHRRICLSGAYNLAGISILPHKAYGSNTVIDFSYQGRETSAVGSVKKREQISSSKPALKKKSGSVKSKKRNPAKRKKKPLRRSSGSSRA